MRYFGTWHLRVLSRTLFFSCLIIIAFSLCCILIENIVSEQTRYFMKAFRYRSLGISTDMTVYPSEKDNVLWYDDSKLKYLINNPNKCENRKPFVLIFVKTHPSHSNSRDNIRKTWGNVANWPEVDESHDVIIFFMMGQSKRHTRTLQASLKKENEIFQDIIQENYIEDFHNLTLKLISQLKWPLRYCRGAKFWMTTDDDVFVHVGNLVSHLRKQKPKYYYSGLVHSGSPRNVLIESKYYVPPNVYHGVYYPDYCPGAGYVLSMDAVEQLYDKAKLVPILYIDDVHVGILAHAAGISPQHYVMFLGENVVPRDLCTLSMFITSHGHTGDNMVQFFDYIMALSSLNPDVVCWGKYLSWTNPNDLVYF